MKTGWVYGIFLSVWLGFMGQASAFFDDVRLADRLKPVKPYSLGYTVLSSDDFQERTLQALKAMEQSLTRLQGTRLTPEERQAEADQQTLIRTVAQILNKRRPNEQVEMVDQLLEKFFRESSHTEWSDKYKEFERQAAEDDLVHLNDEPLMGSARVLFNAINLNDLLLRKAKDDFWKRTAELGQQAIVKNVAWLEAQIKLQIFSFNYSAIKSKMPTSLQLKLQREAEQAFHFTILAMGAAVEGSSPTQQEQLGEILEKVEKFARPDAGYNRDVEFFLESLHLDKVQTAAIWTSKTILGAGIVAIGAAYLVMSANTMGMRIGSEMPTAYVDLAHATLQWTSEHLGFGVAAIATRVATVMPQAAEKAKNMWLKLTKRRKTSILSKAYRAEMNRCQQLLDEELSLSRPVTDDEENSLPKLTNNSPVDGSAKWKRWFSFLPF